MSELGAPNPIDIKSYLEKKPSENISAFLKGVVANLDSYIVRHNAGLDKRPLRERQLTVFEDIRNFLNNGETEGYVKLPTGVGKTVLFTKVIDATRLKTVIGTDRVLSVDQTGEKLETFSQGLDIGKIHHAVKEFGKEVTVTTYDSLDINIKNGKIKPEEIQLLVPDEFDRAQSPKRIETLKKFNNAIKLGFSATPPNETFLKEIHKMSIKEAVQEDLISPFSVFIAQSDVDLTNVRIDSTGEYNEDELGKAINIVTVNQAAVDLYKKMFEGESALAYCAGVEHAKKMSDLLTQSGVKAGFISGKNTLDEQRKILGQFRSGEIKVLCSADLLVRAYDEPTASVCLNLRPTFSPTIAEQRGGRVLRKDPNNEQKHAYIVDFLYETTNVKKFPVSFAQVAGSAHIDILDRSVMHGSDSTDQEKEISLRKRRVDVGSINIPGLKVIFDAEEVLRMAKDMEEKGRPKFQGLINLNVFKIKFNLPSHTGVANKVNVIAKEHPDWIVKEGNRTYLTEHMQEALYDYYSSLRFLSDDVKTINGITITEKIGVRALKNELEEEALDGEIEEGLTEKGVVRTGYKKALVNRVLEKHFKIKHAPKNWSTVSSLAGSNNIGVKILLRDMVAFREQYPRQIRIYRDLKGVPRTHLGPKFIPWVREQEAKKGSVA